MRVFRHFVWLEVDSVKVALSRPAWLSRTQAVGWLLIFEVPASILFAAPIDIKVVKRKRSVSQHKLDIGMKSHRDSLDINYPVGV